MVCLLTVAGAGPPCVAQSGPGTEGPIILQMPASVRAAGLNGAGAALVGDAGAVFSNPAGLATIRHIALETTYRQAPFDAYVAAGAMGLRLNRFNLGVGLHYFHLGSEPEVVPDPSTGGNTGIPTGANVRAYEFLGVGSLVYRKGMLALGGSAKIVRQAVGDVEERGVSGDLGFALAVFDIMAIGFAVQNVSGNWTRESAMVLPRLTRLGFTMNYTDPQETFRLLSTVEAQWPAGRSARLVLGGEGGVVLHGVGVIGRLGYGSRAAESGRGAVVFGASIEVGRLHFDYAYDPSDILNDGGQQLGLRITL